MKQIRPVYSIVIGSLTSYDAQIPSSSLIALKFRGGEGASDR